MEHERQLGIIQGYIRELELKIGSTVTLNSKPYTRNMEIQRPLMQSGLKRVAFSGG